MNHIHTIFLCSQFWIAFWPSFSSTVIGLIIGIQITLWINRIITRRQEKQNKNKQDQKLNNALQILQKTLNENQSKVTDLINVLNTRSPQYDIALDTSAWDAIKDDIVQYLDDTDLKRKIAYHFLRLNTISKLNGMYLDTFIENRKELNSQLLQSSNFILTDIAQILPMISEKLRKK